LPHTLILFQRFNSFTQIKISFLSLKLVNRYVEEVELGMNRELVQLIIPRLTRYLLNPICDKLFFSILFTDKLF